MSIYVNPKFRIKRSADQQEMMQKLQSGNYKIFDSYRDILVLSAVVGFINDKFTPIEKPASDGVLMQFFTERDYDLIDLMAYAFTKDQSVVKTDNKYDIFSSFANAGFPIVLDVLHIVNETVIDQTKQESLLTQLYACLLSNQFKQTVTDDELFV